MRGAIAAGTGLPDFAFAHPGYEGITPCLPRRKHGSKAFIRLPILDT